ncbi:hypothetical protein [Paenisporosarcina sp. OV554]|uniref:hypothetical protein n=1 Tax=Paenisporosarcina sp. OV554 TaxID=2135694 RepID=UPI000D365F62|nr:hypothetical protein [Paenisporosarcina sp. OV554]PUB14591.1 hypothetical protein C8K15_105152 [Paenisporosarcina sp. OV554]
MKNWKKVSAAILAAGLITTSAGQVWANENDSLNTDLEAVNLPETTENVNDETVTVEDLELVASIVPVGYTANNIFALSKNLEKISNPKAKTALQKNIDKALAKWEANKEETELPEVETPETETPEAEVPEVEAPETETHETELPEVEAPETETHETELPEVEAPESEVPVVETPVTKAPEVKEVKAQKTAALAKAEEKKLAGLAVAAKNIEKNAAKKEATQVKVEAKKAAAKEKPAKKDKK